MVQTASDFSGSIPEHYDRGMGPVQFLPFGVDRAGRLPREPAGDVLELACGTGIVTEQLRKRLAPSRRLVATDLSQAMLDYARGKRGAPGIEWRTADAQALPFADAAFAAVVCAFGVMFVPDKKKLFGEARRVLAEGGALLFNVWDGLENNPHGKASGGVISGLFPGDAEMDFARIPYGFNDPAQIQDLLEGCGFREARFHRVRLPIESPSAHSLATGAIRGTPRVALLEKRGASPDAVIERVAEAFRAIGGDEPFRSHMQALVIEAR
jgi:SAM-dependent methyltransferase